MTAQEVAIVAAHAGVVARTVTRALEGKTRSGATRGAIVAALRRFRHYAEARRVEKGAAK